jgi:hypothetical protein
MVTRGLLVVRVEETCIAIPVTCWIRDTEVYGEWSFVADGQRHRAESTLGEACFPRSQAFPPTTRHGVRSKLTCPIVNARESPNTVPVTVLWGGEFLE